MNISMIGLGKLGLPVAVCLGQKHSVLAYDANPDLNKHRQYEHRELGPTKQDDFQAYFDKAEILFASDVRQVVTNSDIVFVAVQTPHGPEYEGVTRLPPTRADFNYKALISAVREIAQYTRPDQPVVVISTVLPGTMRREILWLLKGPPGFPDRGQLVYNPFFIAMGQVMYDFLNPEFVLLGGEEGQGALKQVYDFYRSFYLETHKYDPDVSGWAPPLQVMSIESAELTKVAYNTYLSMKVTVANALMEVCHKIPGCNIDDVTSTLKLATDRVISPKYMDGGMGDGGGCHPRDNIAMSWLANRLALSSDMFGALMKAREAQTDWLVELILRTQRKYNYVGHPLILLGKAYKPETNLTVGSPAILLANMLRERGVSFAHYDPYVDGSGIKFDPPLANGLTEKALFFISTRHTSFASIRFPNGSVVIDPFRYIPAQEGVTIVPVGVGK